MLKKVLFGACVLAAGVAFASPAQAAQIGLRLTDVATATVVVVPLSGGTATGYTGAVGNFTVNILGTVSNSPGFPTVGRIQTSATSITYNGARPSDTLRIEATALDFALPGSPVSPMVFSDSLGASAQLSATGNATFRARGYASPTNAAYGTSAATSPDQVCTGLLGGSLTGDCQASQLALGNFTRAGDYSLTSFLEITLDDALSSVGFSQTVAATAVPEPGSMMLLGTGLFGLARVARRRFNLGAR